MPRPEVLWGPASWKAQYPSSWTFYCPQDDLDGHYGQFVDIVNDPIAAPTLGTSYAGITGSQYLFMYGYRHRLKYRRSSPQPFGPARSTNSLRISPAAFRET